MFSKIAVIATLATAAFAAPQGVTAAIAPVATAPAGCVASKAGVFNIEVINATTVPAKVKRADALAFSLANGQLTDSAGRTGYIAANFQFQFDKPAQTGSIYTAGFSICGNGTLALGGSAVWYQCLSGDFYNLYDRNWAAQCSPVLINTIAGASNTTASSASSAAPSSSRAASQATDGQVAATGAASASRTSSAVVSQITDGQIQATTARSASVVSQITDGQIQATGAASASSSRAVVTQITDGQIQATTARQVTSTTSRAVVSQITDGQIQAPTSTRPVVMFTGAANMYSYANEIVAVAAGAVAAALL